MAPIIETFELIITHLQRNFRVVTVLDIAIVSIFIYSAMVWFKETTSRLVYIGVALVGFVYLLSRAFDLYLTSFLFHIAFAVIAILLIIIFQEDIRRVFERIAVWGIYGGRRQHLNVDINVGVDTVVESVSRLATRKVGALIVVQGRDPLRRHIQGGYILNGKISKPLLLSLFDPGSPGHDGAVIMNSSEILQFGTHLPLTKNPSKVRDCGTRHSAALGLSESTDALIIVVSQERGEISVAEGGKLKKVSSSAALKTRIERFLRARIQKPSIPAWKNFFKARIGMKMGSVVLASFIWMLFSYKTGGIVQRAFMVPIEYRNIGEHIYVAESVPNEIKVTLSGKQAAFTLLDPRVLRVSINLGTLNKGKHEVELKESHIRYPSNLSIYWLEPKVVKINLVDTDLSFQGGI